MKSTDGRSSADRHISAWTRQEKARRLVWSAVEATLFRYSLHTMYGWRRLLLRCFGAQIGRSAMIRRTVRIEVPWNLTMGEHSCLGHHTVVYSLGPIRIGDRVSISQNAHLCAGTHDYTRVDMPLLRPPITIEDDVWIAADAFVGPGITIGRGAILGARGCAFKDLEPWTIYGGNPARAIQPRARLDIGPESTASSTTGTSPA